MKNYLLAGLLFILAGLCLTPLHAQRYFEVGLQGGNMPYNGDLSDPGLGFLKEWNTFGGLYLRFRPISRVGLRLNGIFGRIDEDRTNTLTVAPDSTAQIARNFRSKINEVSIAAEVDLFYLGDPEDRFVAPYIMVGLGITSFNPQSQREGVYANLQPLRTEGQTTPYDLSITTYHLGGGIRGKVSERIVVGLEASGRITNTDYLDDISGRRVNYLDVVSNPAVINARETGYFSNPGVDFETAGEDISYRRGGASDDFYFLLNLTVGIRLGGFGRGGGSGCYSF